LKTDDPADYKARQVKLFSSMLPSALHLHVGDGSCSDCAVMESKIKTGKGYDVLFCLECCKVEEADVHPEMGFRVALTLLQHTRRESTRTQNNWMM